MVNIPELKAERRTTKSLEQTDGGGDDGPSQVSGPQAAIVISYRDRETREGGRKRLGPDPESDKGPVFVNGQVK